MLRLPAEEDNLGLFRAAEGVMAEDDLQDFLGAIFGRSFGECAFMGLRKGLLVAFLQGER